MSSPAATGTPIDDAAVASSASASASPPAIAAVAADEEEEEDLDDEKPPKRIFTASELHAMAQAQAAEDATIRAEAQALRDEQKTLAAAIVKRHVAFGAAPQPAGGSAVAAFGQEPSDYTQHDGRRKLSVLFVADAAGCALQAPLAVAFLRKKQKHVLTGSFACSEAQQLPVEAHPALSRLIDDFGLQEDEAAGSKASASAVSVLSLEQALRLPGATAPHVIVSLDEASRAAADATAEGTSTRRIHHPMVIGSPDASAAAAAEQREEGEDALASRLREFVTDLPELISML